MGTPPPDDARLPMNHHRSPHATASPPRSSRGGHRRQRGAAVVEFALVAPIFFLLLMGIVDFGINLSNQIALRQGAREAARQGTVANFGSTSSCGATLTTPGTENMRRLICLTKDRSGLTAAEPRVAIRFDPASTSYPAPSPGSTAPVGNGLIVCAAVPLTSVSKLLDPVLSDRYIRTKTVMRIEKGSGVAEGIANEADPTGEDWAWCTP